MLTFCPRLPKESTAGSLMDQHTRVAVFTHYFGCMHEEMLTHSALAAHNDETCPTTLMLHRTRLTITLGFYTLSCSARCFIAGVDPDLAKVMMFFVIESIRPTVSFKLGGTWHCICRHSVLLRVCRGGATQIRCRWFGLHEFWCT